MGIPLTGAETHGGQVNCCEYHGAWAGHLKPFPVWKGWDGGTAPSSAGNSHPNPSPTGRGFASAPGQVLTAKLSYIAPT